MRPVHIHTQIHTRAHTHTKTYSQKYKLHIFRNTKIQSPYLKMRKLRQVFKTKLNQRNENTSLDNYSNAWRPWEIRGEITGRVMREARRPRRRVLEREREREGKRASQRPLPVPLMRVAALRGKGSTTERCTPLRQLMVRGKK